MECTLCHQHKPMSEYRMRKGRYEWSKPFPCRWCNACFDLNARWKQMKSKYGITESDYWIMVQMQGGVCAICHRKDRERDVDKYLCVDHDHDTGAVRGLLCARCNAAIGHFGEDVSIIAAAVAYLTAASSEPQPSLAT